MKLFLIPIITVALVCTLFPLRARAQASAPRRVHALRIKEAIRIDGRLDEPAWAQAEILTDFRQQEPFEGQPATERTEVRVLFDEKNVYFGIRAFDSEPRRISARELSRDAEFSNDDKIEILLDTFHDRRSAYLFTVNPLGTQQDALITDEGRSINLTWDAPWISDAKIDDRGWTAEIAIPLTSLRFGEGLDTWGINVARFIRRKNEQDLWTSWQRSFGLERVSEAGELSGLGELQRRRLLEIKPYVTSRWRQGTPRIGAPGFETGMDAAGGIEVARVGITPSLTAEVTVNPDFGQTEVDQQVINLSRFSVFFPEKRDFFLENAGVFLFGREESNQLFFTRRIGLTPDGEPVPIDYGAKITGKLGPYSVGFLQVQTRPEGDAVLGTRVPRQYFTAARVKRDIFRRSYVGVMFVDREDSGGASHHRAGGFDAQIGFTDHWKLNTFIMATDTPGLSSSFISARVDTRYENNLVRFVGVYEDIGSNFNPQLGFAERTGVRQYFGQAAYKPRPRIPHVRRMEFETQLEYYENRAGRLDTRQAELTWVTEFNNSAVIEARFLEDHTDSLVAPFEIRPGIVIPPRSYHFNRPWVEFTTDASKPVVFNFHEGWGDFYSGRRYETSGGVTLRPNAHILLDLNHSYNRVLLPQGDFSTNLFSARASYNFSRRLLTSCFLQLNSAARMTSLNARLRYIFRPHSDFFFIYNQNTGRGLERGSFLLQAKLNYNWTR